MAFYITAVRDKAVRYQLTNNGRVKACEERKSSLDWEPITHMWFVKVHLSIHASVTTNLVNVRCTHCSFPKVSIVQGHPRKVRPEPLKLDGSKNHEDFAKHLH